jgi:glycerol-3-phosphate acyltransferase PlsY
MTASLAIGIGAAYLLGSIPTAVWLGRRWFGIDVRQHGSGNAGATNTLRVLGKKAGLMVLLIDLLKGLLATQLGYLLESGMDPLTERLLLGGAAVIGHVFPVWAEFRGGKGVASVFGAMVGIHGLVSLLMVGLFALVVAVSRYVSVASMAAALAFPLLLIWIEGTGTTLRVVGAAFLGLFIVFTHRSNIQRLCKGSENKLSLSQRSR